VTGIVDVSAKYIGNCVTRTSPQLATPACRIGRRHHGGNAEYGRSRPLIYPP